MQRSGITRHPKLCKLPRSCCSAWSYLICMASQTFTDHATRICDPSSLHISAGIEPGPNSFPNCLDQFTRSILSPNCRPNAFRAFLRLETLISKEFDAQKYSCSAWKLYLHISLGKPIHNRHCELKTLKSFSRNQCKLIND